jgi:hypothetical protein
MGIVRVNGRKIPTEIAIEILISSRGSGPKADAAFAAHFAALDRRTAIANAIAARDQEIAGKPVDFYRLKRAQIEAEETAKYDAAHPEA